MKTTLPRAVTLIDRRMSDDDGLDTLDPILMTAPEYAPATTDRRQRRARL